MNGCNACGVRLKEGERDLCVHCDEWWARQQEAAAAAAWAADEEAARERAAERAAFDRDRAETRAASGCPDEYPW